MTSPTNPPPHDLVAEEYLLGAMLLSQMAVEEVRDLVGPSDFYAPSHALIFEAISNLYANGEPINPLSAWREIERMEAQETVGDLGRLVRLQTDVPSTTTAPQYARMVTEMALYRALLAQARDLAAAARAATTSPADLAERSMASLREIANGIMTGAPEGLTPLSDFLDRPEEAKPAWIVPGLLRVGWRCMVVAPEGAGKTVLLRQFGIAAAQGLHPFTRRPIEPSRVLVVDLENPGETIDSVCGPMIAMAKRTSESYDDDRLWLWHRPAGIDLRTRRGRSELEATIQAARPDLVCIGPVYKMMRVKSGEGHEVPAAEVQNILDDLRTRYQFGLLMEHHAPGGEKGKARAMDPYGTVLWRRWPELGFGLVPTTKDANTMLISRFRGDRLDNDWPEKLERGMPGMWPWDGVYSSGTFNSGRPLAAVGAGAHDDEEF